jgi:Xaa-Pro dipeptidase
LRRAYDAVKEANAAGRAAASPGKTGQDVDRAARGIINAAGFGGYFTHRTGHGLGLEGHEEPDMKEGETMPLEPGMTFTVEPGIYIPGKGGARIEDDVVITAGGAETMTTLPRDFTRLA